MNELQPVPRNPIPQTADRLGAVNIPKEPIPIEIPAAEPERGYGGVLEYWQMIRRHKGAIVFATFLGGGVGFLLTLAEPRIYQARTTLEFQGLNEEFLNMKNVSPTISGTGGAYLNTDIQTQVKILQSRLLVSRVREKLEARERPEDLQPPDRLGVWRKALKMGPPDPDGLWRQALAVAALNVKVRSFGTNRIVEVTCDSTSPRLAADFCNTLSQEYIDETLEARWKGTEYTGQWLTRQLQDLKVKLEKQQEELQSYARATGLVFTNEKNNVQETTLADLQKELSAAQGDRIAKQSKYEMAATSPTGALPDVLDDVSLKDSQKDLADLQAKLAQLRVTFTPYHSEVKRVQAQIAATEASLQAAGSNVLTRIRKEFEAAARRETLLANAYTAQAREVSGQAEEAAHYSLLKREADATRLLYETLLLRLKEASISSALRANSVRVVDAAERPSIPYKPDVRRTGAIGLLLGLMGGFAFVVLRERADRTLQDPGDVTYYLGLPELGVVPVAELSGAPRSKRRSRSLSLRPKDERSSSGEVFDDRVEMISARQEASPVAESFRTTLTSILFSRRSGDRPRVLVLSSASPQEGKTTVVCNLGISFAEINHTVLLIDADTRRPRLQSVFNIENDRGWSNLLMEKTPLDAAKLDAACAPTSIPGLSVLPSGSFRRNASSLLHSARLSELLDLARARFDMVIVDTPPMINIADARVIARLSDALILVVRSGVTTRDAALVAKWCLAADGIPILGTILNCWNPKKPGHSYYGYSYAPYHYDDNGNGNGNSNGGGDTPTPSGSPAEPPAWTGGLALRPQLREGHLRRESQS
jgi:succinoglycan biosynthesis transport protein ExoP